ncbi:MAG: zinc ribbon domain-containing protein [Acidobacteriota bacterium]
MFCPKCGQERVSIDTSFCSRCGFLLTGAADLLQTGGLIPQLPARTGFKVESSRNRGLKQGLFIFLLTFLVVPLVAIITVALRLEPWGIPIAAITLFIGGLLRMAYAVMFESPVPAGQTLGGADFTGSQSQLNRPPSALGLPSQQSYPVSSYVSPATGNWRDTNDLQPTSVTEGTTKLLENEELPPHLAGSSAILTYPRGYRYHIPNGVSSKRP